MYNPYMMNPMGGGMNNYWSPQRMQNAQPMGMYSQDAMQGAQKRDQMQGRVDNLQGRIGNLQEQYKAAGADQQAGIQNRINTLQGRMGDLQGKMDAGGGANRMGMEYRRERRQAKNAGTYDPQAQGGQPEPAMMQGGFNPWGGMGGMGMGGMGFGGYGGWQSGGGMGGMGEMAYRGGMPQGMYPQPQYRTQEAGQNQTGATPVGPYNPQASANGPNQPAPPGLEWYKGVLIPAHSGRPGDQYTDQFGNVTDKEGYYQRQQAGVNGMLDPQTFSTKFGNLVTSSSGNSNVYKRQGDDPSGMLFHYDPNQGWKSMTPEEYAGYGDYQYFNPMSSMDAARAAGAQTRDWWNKNGAQSGGW